MIHKILPLALAVGLLACRPSETAPRKPEKLAPDPALQASDLPREEIIARHLAARGGAEKLAGIRSVRMTGTFRTPEGTSPIVIAIGPGRYVRRIEQSPGAPMIHVVDGETSWEISPRIGVTRPRPLSPQDLSRFRHLADPQGPLVGFAAKGNRVEVLGMLTWEGHKVYKLAVTFPDQGRIALYLDAESFLPVRMVSPFYVPPLGKDIDAEFVFRNYREVGGVQWPFTEGAHLPEVDFQQEITWDKVEVNVPLDAALFAPPQP